MSKHFLGVGLLGGNWLTAGCRAPFIDVLGEHFAGTVAGNFLAVKPLLSEGRAFPAACSQVLPMHLRHGSSHLTELAANAVFVLENAQENAYMYKAHTYVQRLQSQLHMNNHFDSN